LDFGAEVVQCFGEFFLLLEKSFAFFEPFGLSEDLVNIVSFLGIIFDLLRIWPTFPGMVKY
jgi:hypothetical protein